MPDQRRKRPTGKHDPSASSLRRWDNEGGAPAGGRKRSRDPAQLAKFVIDVATGEVEDVEKLTPAQEFAREGGLKGGKARAAAMTPAQRRAVAKKAAAARWKKPRS